MCVPSGRLAPSVGDAAVVCICVCVCVNRHARHKAGTGSPKFACPKVHRCPFPVPLRRSSPRQFGDRAGLVNRRITYCSPSGSGHHKLGSRGAGVWLARQGEPGPGPAQGPGPCLAGYPTVYVLYVACRYVPTCCSPLGERRAHSPARRIGAFSSFFPHRRSYRTFQVLLERPRSGHARYALVLGRQASLMASRSPMTACVPHRRPRQTRRWLEPT